MSAYLGTVTVMRFGAPLLDFIKILILQEAPEVCTLKTVPPRDRATLAAFASHDAAWTGVEAAKNNDGVTDRATAKTAETALLFKRL